MRPSLPVMVLSRLNTAQEFERGERLLQVACQVSTLTLEMTEDALRDASAYVRWWASKPCVSKRALCLFLIAGFTFSNYKPWRFELDKYFACNACNNDFNTIELSAASLQPRIRHKGELKDGCWLRLNSQPSEARWGWGRSL